MYPFYTKSRELKHRIFIEKKPSFDIHTQLISKNLKSLVDIKEIKIFLIYDIFNVEKGFLNEVLYKVFADKVTDRVYEDFTPEGQFFAIEYLPGQYDQRADSAEQSLLLLGCPQNPIVRTGKLIQCSEVSTQDFEKIKSFFINPVDSREKKLEVLEVPVSLPPQEVLVYENFENFNSQEFKDFYSKHSFAMDEADLLHIQNYYKSIQRNPTETELKVLDTYWSDHCRHTTFLTELEHIQFEGPYANEVKKSFDLYLSIRKKLNKEDKAISLMDIAIIMAPLLRMENKLEDVFMSIENNAATLEVDISKGQEKEKWLLMFKNETHNHPTEIEPFGGAATCIGGAIRDPLSGRTYIHQAIRISGAGNILESVEKTLAGKLPQKKITQEAALGYSSYGNQIGLATSLVHEIYDEGYKAKRLELGVVLGANKKENILQKEPQQGDLVMLIGGRTGRDGIGGATGSSKKHTTLTVENMSAEVQKGNAVEERKIQRLFRNPQATKLVKKCNDFGAGGVSVAVGELAPGIDIHLDALPTKYQGLNGTELAISESQERLAVVIDKKDKKEFEKLCLEENIEVTEIAQITDDNKLVMRWKNETLVDIDREFLDTNGAPKKTRVTAWSDKVDDVFKAKNWSKENLLSALKSLSLCSQKGLVENFDSTVGCTTVLMPFGGRYQLTPTEGSVHVFPTLDFETTTASLIAWGYMPEVFKSSCYHGGHYSIIQSIAKIVALGGHPKKIRLSLQEYFERLEQDPKKWGKPFSALLGALQAQYEFQIAAIGGKDSMSGTYQNIHVPPTLVSFAVVSEEIENIISPEFKNENHALYYFHHTWDNNFLPNYPQLIKIYLKIHELIKKKIIVSAKTINEGGIAVASTLMSFGNKIGFEISTDLSLFQTQLGSLILETTEPLDKDFILIGKTNNSHLANFNGDSFTLDELIKTWSQPLEDIFPTLVEFDTRKVIEPDYPSITIASQNFGKPKVLIPIFPGTNCEYETELAFKKEGAKIGNFVIQNLNKEVLENSIQNFCSQLKESQILCFPGGFSAGDEPDGSAKYMVAFLKNKSVKEALDNYLQKGNLILGICNGFQALVKSGLLPYGSIQDLEEDSPTLTINAIGRHISQMVHIKVVNDASPWLQGMKGQIFTIPISHGEGRFFANDKQIQKLIQQKQIASMYVNNQNIPTLEMPFNPNGSMNAIEGIISEDGKIYGRMGHTERYRKGLLKNIPQANYHNIFKNGVQYFL